MERFGRWWLVVAVGLGNFIVQFDFSVNVALPAMTADLGVPIASLQWVILGYQLTIAIPLLGLGRLTDVWDSRRIYLFGLIGFGLGSGLCALAPELTWLVAARAVQGIGTALLLSSGPAIITGAFPPHERGRATGAFGAASALGSVAGAIGGGTLTDLFGWRAIFVVRPPVCALAFALTLLVVAAPRRRGPAPPFDWRGTFAFGVAITAGLLMLNRLSLGGLTPVNVVLAVVAFGALAAFVVVELRSPAPLVDLRYFRNLAFAAANVAWTLTWFGGFCIWVIMPYYLSETLGYSATIRGFLYAVQAVAMALAAPVSGWASDYVGTRWPAAGALALTSGALLWLGQLGERPAALALWLGLAAFGFGLGAFQSANNSAIMGGVTRTNLGIGSSLISLGRYAGVVTAVAVDSGLYTTWQMGYQVALTTGFAADEALRRSVALAYRDIFTFGAAIVGLAFVCTLARGDLRREEPTRSK
ncbi:MAG: MFS transporter [Chloroflexi bacterium]|nr:MFS transporter [Chloroflexota bacterium]